MKSLLTNFFLQLQSIKLRIFVALLNLFHPLTRNRSSSHRPSQGGSGIFRGKHSSSRRSSGPRPSPYSRPRLLPAHNNNTRKAEPSTRPIIHAAPIIFPNPPRKETMETKDLLFDLRRVGGRLKRFSKRRSFSSWARSITKNGLGWL